MPRTALPARRQRLSHLWLLLVVVLLGGVGLLGTPVNGQKKEEKLVEADGKVKRYVLPGWGGWLGGSGIIWRRRRRLFPTRMHACKQGKEGRPPFSFSPPNPPTHPPTPSPTTTQLLP